MLLVVVIVLMMIEVMMVGEVTGTWPQQITLNQIQVDPTVGSMLSDTTFKMYLSVVTGRFISQEHIDITATSSPGKQSFLTIIAGLNQSSSSMVTPSQTL